MRLTPLAIGSALGGCLQIALTSCSTDERDTEAGLAPTVSQSVAAVSAYDIVKVVSMSIDGQLNDWANIAAISMADDPSNGRGAKNNSAKVKLAWDDTYLYAAYDVTDNELLAVQTTRDHPDLAKDDEVELYIDPQGDGADTSKMTSTDYHFLANVRDAVGDNRGNASGGQDPSFNAASFLAKAATNGTLNGSGTDVGYTVEMRVSWSDLGITPATGNFMRMDPAVGDRDSTAADTEEFDWAGLTSFNNPSGWKDVKLVTRAPPVSAYDIAKVSPMTIDGNLSEWAGITPISMADTSGRSETGVDNSATVRLAWDPTYLYFAYDVTDTELLAEQTVRDNGEIYKDDEVELYIDPQGDGWVVNKMTPTDYHVLANVRNALADNSGTTSGGYDASYNAAGYVTHAVTNGTLNGGGTDVGYVVEGRIAWSDLGVTPTAGNFMRMDPAVGDRDTPADDTEEFDWAGLTSFNNPSAWKDVKLSPDGPPPPDSAPGGTIGVAPRNGTLWDISGNSHRTRQYSGAVTGSGGPGPGANNFSTGSRINAGFDATLTTWRNNVAGDPAQDAFTVSRLGVADDISFEGGRVLGSSLENGSVPWDHDNPVPPGSPYSWTSGTRDYHSQTALAIGRGRRMLIQQFSAHNKGDGIGVSNAGASQMDGCDGTVLRWNALTHMGDDVIENDWKDEITLYQNYLSGVSILSTRPGTGSVPENTNTSSKVVTLDGNLMRLTPKSFPDMKPASGSYGDPVVFTFFKWQVNVNPQYAMKIALHNNVLLWNGDPIYSGGNSIWGSLNPNQVSASTNNVALFPTLTSPNLPAGWPASLPGFTYLYGDAARARWNQEINAWMQAHPDVIVTDPGLF